MAGAGEGRGAGVLLSKTFIYFRVIARVPRCEKKGHVRCVLNVLCCDDTAHAHRRLQHTSPRSTQLDLLDTTHMSWNSVSCVSRVFKLMVHAMERSCKNCHTVHDAPVSGPKCKKEEQKNGPKRHFSKVSLPVQVVFGLGVSNVPLRVP